jgi:hypothetical protein
MIEKQKLSLLEEQHLQALQKSTAVPVDIIAGDGQTIERVLYALCKAFDLDSTEHKTLRDTIAAIQREQGVAQRERDAARSSWMSDVRLMAMEWIPADVSAAPAAFELLRVCVDLAVFLMRKNIAYGDSALSPLRAISQADPVEQIRVRMDDKLSRIIRGQAAGEDALKDLVGYWVLLQVLERRKSQNGGA